MLIILTIILTIINSKLGQINQDLYEQLITEKVSEDYCRNVITNLTSLIEQGYVYLDFLKEPKQPERYMNYTNKVDLIYEFNKIKKNNRTFYDFYRDIFNIIKKTNDVHLDFHSLLTPKKFNLLLSYFCIPFEYKIITIKDENSKIIDVFISIELRNECEDGYTIEILSRIKDLSEKQKKIIEINGMNPYQYFENLSLRGRRSTQAKYVSMLNIISDIPIYLNPYKKEELNLSIKFEGEEELLKLDYHFYKRTFGDQPSFNNFELLKKEKTKSLKNVYLFHSIRRSFNYVKGKNNNNIYDEKIWDLNSVDNSLKCKVDDENELNVLYQNSFYTIDFENYENTMYECFSKFYSNNYKIVVIEDSNRGGFTELCIPFQQYIFPKISKPQGWNLKSSELNKDIFFQNDENINIETCKTYTEKDNILDGEEDNYGEGVIHKKTKTFEQLNIFEKKIMEKKRKEYLSTGFTKKPTEILIFTDGNSFSCTSIVIKGLQMSGIGIMVGYNSRPDLIGQKFEASISNSIVGLFSSSKYIENLNELNFYASITFSESFDYNNKTNPKIPNEFLVYPIDENSNIFSKYEDSLYNLFIHEAKKIFDKYNDLNNGQCNPSNKYLYYEAKECNDILNIEHAHGGYICGSDGKWNKSKCIAAYCDIGYILNDERIKCEEDPCEKYKLIEISFKDENKSEFIIEPDNVYIFKNFKENISLYIHTDFEKPLFYKYNNEHTLEKIDYLDPINENDIIYANFYMNISKNVKININNNIPDGKDNNRNKDNSSKNNNLPTYAIILIAISIIIFVLAIFFIIMKIIKKKNNMSINDLSNIEPLNNI